MSENVQMGIPERIVVKITVSMEPRLASELLKTAEAAAEWTREDSIKALTDWAYEFKKDLEELPGVQVGVQVEEVI